MRIFCFRNVFFIIDNNIMERLIYKEDAFKVIGCCMEVHKTLCKGFSEIVYKEALEYEFQVNTIPYVREAECKIPYKKIILRKTFNADFLYTIKLF